MRAPNYLKLLLSPWDYGRPAALGRLAEELEALAGRPNCLLTANGRSALLAIFNEIPHEPGDEVIVQAFTCVVAVNPVLWAGMKPVFVDVDRETLSLSIESLRDRITDRTRVIVVQHTFGIPGPIEAVLAIARERGIVVVEDCAHALGISNQSGRLGSFGDLSMFSFGVDKQLSSKAGGAILGSDGKLWARVGEEWSRIPELRPAETMRWLAFPLIRMALRRVPTGWTSSISSQMERLGILRQAVSGVELEGGYPPGTPSQMPGAFAEVILSELESFPQLQAHRQSMVDLYKAQLDGLQGASWPAGADGPLMRFPLLISNQGERDRIKTLLVAANFDVTTWYDPPIFPRGVDYSRIGYVPATNPVAEDISKRIVCLPTGRNIDAENLGRLTGMIRSNL